ncbi:uncharacterized protein PHALS_13155 [Plasmopara halstedii]|uniref:Uncharacterized protein n=1 Tax=Plasmopara halstedii TaxID=4781 RepID=A0A0P1AQ10_PLAHL|nr:uncharacterized protein PHALS_13155 [Plasmopara halstedii]CEG42920.1 hypothetical protein PHALS_13155 [Plasmopara halstedii]|eukprot:XP_024579289.1 hypothetical protein PHALS_13155 [Plasmopara halstedii]
MSAAYRRTDPPRMFVTAKVLKWRLALDPKQIVNPDTNLRLYWHYRDAEWIDSPIARNTRPKSNRDITHHLHRSQAVIAVVPASTECTDIDFTVASAYRGG